MRTPLRSLIGLLILGTFVACNEGGKAPASVADSLAPAEISPKQLAVDEIPAGIRFRGTLYKALQWQDKKGDNLLITSLTAPYHSGASGQGGEEERSAELYAFHFVKNESGQYRLLWQLADAERECPVDISCAFLDQGISVTDLDKNGIAETTIAYKLACRGDVSPASMKLIIHQDTAKYALRGQMWNRYLTEDTTAVLPVTEKDVNLATLPGYRGPDKDYMKTYGRYENEKDFEGAPASFLPYVRQQWLKLAPETFE